MKPQMLDLCCGRGGWSKAFLAHGFDCYGYDIDEKFRALYPGNFIRGDVREVPVDELRGQDIRLVCASSPCEEFSRFTMPWTRAKNPPEPKLGIELAHACFGIAAALKVPLIFENVMTAQRWLGRAVMHCGPFYLWGDGVPALLPSDVRRRVKESYGSKERDKRAEIPFDLADWIARQYA